MITDLQKPVVFLAFANDREQASQYLRNLAEEQRLIRKVLETAKLEGLCEFVERSNASATDIFEVFRSKDYRNRIAVFHFGGHANSYQLLLESAEGNVEPAYASGIAAFLRQQRGLQLVFLNACSTRPQVDELLQANISAVVATSRAIEDRTAMEFAAKFYGGLASGASIEKAYKEAEASIQTKKGNSFRNAYLASAPIHDRWPWELHIKKGAEIVSQWNLPQCVGNPLFSLPPLVPGALPDEPFRHLNWFTRKDAEIFFGRGRQIRELYDRVTSSDSAQIILLYGQSGVGKSSVLEAGLLPRLEPSFEVRYMRRIQELGLLGTLNQAFLPGGQENSLTKVWLSHEAKLGKPVVMILDQVEEVYTRPNKGMPEELAAFLSELEILFANFNNYPKGKLILSFRKEWLPEIEEKLKERKFARAKVFLGRLDREGIIESISGLARSERLGKHYGITVEDGLDSIIADDMFEDPDSPIAPTLQILLTKMWHEATKKDNSHPHFDTELYRALRSQGILLGDFLDQQIAEIKRRTPDSVDSGLVLDILEFHATSLGTAEKRRWEDLNQRYSHRDDLLATLIRRFKELYLLSDPVADVRNRAEATATRLAHDTLAPLVRLRFDRSTRPGQRSRRILENRVEEWMRDQKGAALSERELAVVEQGSSGMRAWTQDEKLLIEASRVEHRKKRLRVWKAAGIYAAILIVISGGFVWWQRILTRNAQQLALTRKLIADSKAQLQIDPELSLLLAIKANQRGQTPEAVDALRQSLIASHLRVEMRGHTGTLRGASFSPDGNLVVTASDDKTVRVWEAHTGKAVAELKGHTDEVFGAEFSPDGKWIVTASADKTARLWQAQTWESTATLQHSGRVTSARFSRDGKSIITASDKTVRVWDVATRATIKELKGFTVVGQAAFSPNGKLVVTSTDKVQIWEVATWRRLAEFSGPNQNVEERAIFSPDSKFVVSASTDGAARVWEVGTGRAVAQLSGHAGGVFDAVFSPNSKFIVTVGKDKTVRVWETIRWQNIGVFRGHTDMVFGAAFSPDGKLVVTASGDKSARIWLVNEAELYSELDGPTSRLGGATFSPDGSLVVTARDDKTARVCEARTGKVMAELQGHTNEVLGAEFSPDGKWVVTASADGTARLWQARMGLYVAELRGHTDKVLSAKFDPDSRFVVTASDDKTIRVWQVPTGQNVAELKGPTDTLEQRATAMFSPNGKYILSTDGLAVWVWDASTYKNLTRLELPTGGVISAAFNPASDYIAAGGDGGGLMIWGNKSTGGRRIQLEGHEQNVLKVSFSSDGKYLVTASGDETTRVWDTSTGKSLLVLRDIGGAFQYAEFSPNNKFIVTANQDSIVRVWDIGRGNIVAELKQDLGGYVSEAKFSPKGDLILIASTDGPTRIYGCEVCDSPQNLLDLARSRVTRSLTQDELQDYVR